MRRIAITFRIAICMALLSLCALLCARVLGLFPDSRQIRLEGRVALCESLAINCSILANRNDVVGIEKTLKAFVTRNSEVLSSALRGTDGELLLKVGSHDKHWHSNDEGSTDANVYVPITASDRRWGTIEVAFHSAAAMDPGTPWMPVFVEFALFVTCFNALVFIFWLRRVLMHLDPSPVVPQRVRGVIDMQERSVMVNASPILGEDGKSRGVLASFDDVTDLDTKKSQLLTILKSLKTSREEIQEQNLQLKRLATLDPLTECMNRRSFFPEFQREWEVASRDGTPLSGAMVDVDYFKSINDEHGHAKGDEVLKGVAACLRQQVGEDGLVCRLGGEEFFILFPGFALAQAAERADVIRVALSRIDVDVVKITASLGVSSIELGANNPQELLEQADKCLYVAKRNGRNQVVRYSGRIDDIEADESKIRRTRTAENARSAQSQIPFAAVASLTSALAYRHAATAEHSSRVADLCVSVARGLMSMSESYVLEIAALLHDIGKIGVPDAILLKPAKLTAEEWRVMNMNERIGVEIVSAAFDCEPLVQIIHYHRAPFSPQADVTHMPSGEQLPLGARILAIADAYDAMVTEQSYRPALARNEAFAELRRCAGIQFDPKLVERFIDTVTTKPGLSPQAAQHLSRQTAIHLATQIEELATALDEQDLAAIEALSGRLRATAACSGAAEVEQLADRIHANVANSDDVGDLFDLTMELMDLCRAAQRTHFTSAKRSADDGETKAVKADTKHVAGR